MDLGISKCAVTGCPNKSKMNPIAFKAHIQATNIKYRNQPVPVLDQHEPYTYLGINLAPSLKWKTQINTTTAKAIKQCQALVACPATMKQKNQHGGYNYTCWNCIQLLCSTILSTGYQKTRQKNHSTS